MATTTLVILTSPSSETWSASWVAGLMEINPLTTENPEGDQDEASAHLQKMIEAGQPVAEGPTKAQALLNLAYQLDALAAQAREEAALAAAE